jgi:hypothetical protein
MAFALTSFRSPCRSLADFITLFNAVKAERDMSLVGVMGYEV